jgi:hypothetical protein
MVYDRGYCVDRDDASGRASRRVRQAGTYRAMEWSSSFLVKVSTSLGRLGEMTARRVGSCGWVVLACVTWWAHVEW